MPGPSRGPEGVTCRAGSGGAWPWRFCRCVGVLEARIYSGSLCSLKCPGFADLNTPDKIRQLMLDGSWHDRPSNLENNYLINNYRELSEIIEVDLPLQPQVNIF